MAYKYNKESDLDPLEQSDLVTLPTETYSAFSPYQSYGISSDDDKLKITRFDDKEENSKIGAVSISRKNSVGSKIIISPFPSKACYSSNKKEEQSFYNISDVSSLDLNEDEVKSSRKCVKSKL